MSVFPMPAHPKYPAEKRAELSSNCEHVPAAPLIMNEGSRWLLKAARVLWGLISTGVINDCAIIAFISRKLLTHVRICT